MPDGGMSDVLEDVTNKEVTCARPDAWVRTVTSGTTETMSNDLRSAFHKKSNRLDGPSRTVAPRGGGHLNDSVSCQQVDFASYNIG